MDLDSDFILPTEAMVAIQLLFAARNNAVQTIMRNTWDLIRSSNHRGYTYNMALTIKAKGSYPNKTSDKVAVAAPQGVSTTGINRTSLPFGRHNTKTSQNDVKIIQRRRLLRKKQEIRRKRHRYHCQRLFPNFMNTIVANFPISQSIKKFRTIRWWEMARNSLSDKDWMEHFRMSRNTYLGIVNELEKSHFAVWPTQKGALDMGTKCAVAIFKLTNISNYTYIAGLFGIHSSTVFCCINLFCKAVNEVLLPQYLRMPNVEEAEDIANNFETMSCLPQVLGALDLTHIPVNVQKDRKKFLNSSGWPSLILQAVVDNRYLFRNISCNNPGTCDEVEIFTDCDLYKNIQELLPSSPRTLLDTEMDLYFVGNAVYPLLPWLITPHLDPEEDIKESFNIYLNTALDVVQIAFNKLKGRFPCLSRKSEFLYSTLPMIITTCVVLHNIVEVSGDEFQPIWFDNLKEGEIKYPQPPAFSSQSLESAEGVANRDFLTGYMADSFELVNHAVEA